MGPGNGNKQFLEILRIGGFNCLVVTKFDEHFTMDNGNWGVDFNRLFYFFQKREGYNIGGNFNKIRLDWYNFGPQYGNIDNQDLFT